ncbi:putative hydrolase of the HAD superfamily [Maritalea mobilis]|uniref:Putative hydrolase of the HAD superfamily n=1 Tax=Maritalea mobilis TaxID=483324 RepID=A0A4R6VRH4_9HYPH|nr:HAD-IA family hydrolase [Maritalea mobilis]TDQ66622.1 putative hydrolase of the HAD superfamily [Maritalea mobilis]
MRSILFDVDGVVIHSLFHQDPARIRSWKQHLHMDFGIEVETFKSFFRNHYSGVVTGERSIVSALDEFLPSIGADHVNSLDLLEYWFKNDMAINRQLLNGIKQLKQKADVKIYLATNQEHLRAFYMWHDLKLSHIFDDMFYAARLGAAKPDPAFFQKVDHLLGPQSEAPLFFDDGQKNVDAGLTQGWDSVLFETEADFFNHPWVNKFLK